MTEALFKTPAVAGAPVPAAAGHNAGRVVEGETSAARSVHVVGLDVSLTATGIACAYHATVIPSAGKRDDTLAQRQQRLRRVRSQIIRTIADWVVEPDLIVIEGPSYNSKNAASSHDRSGLWWLLIDVFTVRGWKVVEVPPKSRMKYATGSGSAPKDAVLAAAVRRLPFDDINDNNAADAAWLCAIGHDLLGQPLVQLPAAQHAAIDIYRLPPDREGARP